MKHTIREIELKNGAKGLIINVPEAQVVNIEINFRAGEYLIDDDKWEVPHLMEHILLGANEKFPKARLFQAEIEKNGAYTNASTGIYDITYEAECADFEWQRVLDLLLLAITKPLFLEQEFKAEYGNVREELMSRSNNHFRELSIKMRHATGFIAKPDKDRLGIMKNIKLNDIVEHYRRTHGSANMRFCIGGNFTPSRIKTLKAMLEAIDLPRRRRFALPDEMPKKLDKSLLIRNNSIDNIYVYMDTFLKRRIDEDERDALGLANTILTETLYSKILGTARERGLIYDMGSGIALPKLASNWWFGAQVSLENAGPFLDIMVDEICKLRGGKLTQVDIDAAKQYSLGRYMCAGQTVGSVVSGYSSRYFFDEVVDDYYRIPERIKAINKSSIIEATKAMFEQKLWAFGVLGKTSQAFSDEMRERLSKLWA